MWQWSKKQTSEQVDTSRELMDRVTAKQERLGKYEEKTYWNPDKGSLGQELDAINTVLEEINYYGLIKESKLLKKIKKSELLKYDTGRISELWKTLKFKGEDVQRRIKSVKKKGTSTEGTSTESTSTESTSTESTSTESTSTESTSTESIYANRIKKYQDLLASCKERWKLTDSSS